MNRMQTIGVVFLRVAVAAMMVIHGVTRLRNGTVGEFGEFLTQNHIPTGAAFAWVLTGMEIVGGLTLAAGFLVVWLCAWFAVQLVVGIVLVHYKQGWFVVGAGTGGMEYSVLLIAGFLAVALTHWPQKREWWQPKH